MYIPLCASLKTEHYLFTGKRHRLGLGPKFKRMFKTNMPLNSTCYSLSGDKLGILTTKFPYIVKNSSFFKRNLFLV